MVGFGSLRRIEKCCRLFWVLLEETNWIQRKKTYLNDVEDIKKEVISMTHSSD